MNIQDLKEGQHVQINHSRKGLFTGIVKKMYDTSIIFTLTSKVKGLANTWDKGEDLTVITSFCTLIKIIE